MPVPNAAISAQGTLIYRAPAATPTAFVEIGDLHAITPPPLNRNSIETTSHAETDASFIVGIRRMGAFTFQIGFNPTTPSHGTASGLMKAWEDGSRDVYKVVYPTGNFWVFSGSVTNMGPSAPVDEQLVADVTIQPTGSHIFG